MEHIYAQDVDRDSNTVEVFIARLRRKLGAVDHRDRARSGLSHRGDGVRPSLAALAAPGWARRCGRSGLMAVGRARHRVILLSDTRYPPAHSTARAHGTGARRAVRRALPGRRAVAGAARARSPIEQLRRRLAAVRDGQEPARRRRRIQARSSRWSTTSTCCSSTAKHAVARAIAKAGDLAHGLKTPLAVLDPRSRARRRRRPGRARRGHRRSRSIGCGGRPTTTSRRPAPQRRARRPARARRARSPPDGLIAHAAAPARRARPHHRRRRPAHHGPRASARTSTRCSATCSTTPASGRARPSGSSSTADRRPRVVIAVDDDGPGLAPAMRDRGAAARRARRRGGARLRTRPGDRARSRRALRRVDRAGTVTARRRAGGAAAAGRLKPGGFGGTPETWSSELSEATDAQKRSNEANGGNGDFIFFRSQLAQLVDPGKVQTFSSSPFPPLTPLLRF